MRTMLLKADKLNAWFKNLINSGDRIIAPVKAGELILFSKISSPDEIVLEEGLTTKSAKGVFFPPIGTDP